MTQKLPIFIDAEQLSAVRDQAELQIVAVETEQDYAQAHIPGALRLAMPDFTASRPPVAGLLPDDAVLAQVFSQAGLRNDAHIVAYDRAGDGQAARLLYTLDVMGHDGFSLLDGGLAAWHAAGLALETGPAPTDASAFRVKRDYDAVADRDWIETHLQDSDARFLDVRSAAEYAGTDVRSARGGHIPGAVHLDWLEFKDEHGRLRARDELVELLERHGITKDERIATYCQSHVRSSYAYLVMKALGYAHVRGYPGAWSDWGNAEDTPVETG